MLMVVILSRFSLLMHLGMSMRTGISSLYSSGADSVENVAALNFLHRLSMARQVQSNCCWMSYYSTRIDENPCMSLKFLHS